MNPKVFILDGSLKIVCSAFSIALTYSHDQ